MNDQLEVAKLRHGGEHALGQRERDMGFQEDQMGPAAAHGQHRSVRSAGGAYFVFRPQHARNVPGRHDVGIDNEDSHARTSVHGVRNLFANQMPRGDGMSAGRRRWRQDGALRSIIFY